MLIHAYRRKEPVQIDTGNTKLEFEKNDAGDVVAAVTDSASQDILLAIGEAFRPYKAEPVAKTEPAVELFKYRLHIEEDDTFVDLATMDDEELRAFAKLNDVSVHHKITGDKLRDKILDAFSE